MYRVFLILLYVSELMPSATYASYNTNKEENSTIFMDAAAKVMSDVIFDVTGKTVSVEDALRLYPYLLSLNSSDIDGIHFPHEQYVGTECAQGNQAASCDTQLPVIPWYTYWVTHCPDHGECSAARDCTDLQHRGFTTSGIYTIWPEFLNHPIYVYCDMDTVGGGWTVIQRRGDFVPHISFEQTWEKYKKGFGNLNEDFWLGNDVIFALTNQAKTELRVDLEDFGGNRRYAEYGKFLVRSEIEKYKLEIGDYSGNAGDSMSGHNNAVFSTKDKSINNCPLRYKGAWWYVWCHYANLNGIYLHGEHSSYADGINWYTFKGYYYSLKSADMKIRPVGH